MSTYTAWRRKLQAASTRWWPYRVIKAGDDDVPDRLRWRRIYAVGTPAWRAVFTCPCGCGDTVDLSVTPQIRPSWTLGADGEARATLSPSVWRDGACRSHYFIRQGRLLWV
jgi:hypothetical protein